MKYYVVILFLVMTLYAGPGFFSETYVPRTFTRPGHTKEIEAPKSQPTVSMQIDVGDTIGKVLPSIFGNNENSVMGKGLLTDVDFGQKHLQNANINTLRLPGGSWSNQWLWDGKNHWGDALHEDYVNEHIMSLPTKTWTYTTDELLAICKASNATPQICVNYALSRYIDAPDAVEQAAHYAAEWVRDVNIKKGLGVTYWEVGNENFGDWEKGFVVNGDTITAEIYGKDFCVFVDSMKAADPSIKVGAVVLGANEWSSIAEWTATVIKEVQNHADFLVVHDYFNWKADANSITVEEVLNGLSQIRQNREYLDQCVKDNSTLSAGGLPIAMTEFNIYGGKKNSSFLGGMFLSRALGEVINEGYGLLNFWGAVGAWDNSESDMGMLSHGEPGVQEYTPHASFFPYYFYNRCFGDHMVKSSSSKSDVTLYASTFSSGHLGLVITNSGDRDEVVQIDVNEFSVGTCSYIYTLDADSMSARSFRINGERSKSGLHGPLDYEDIVPYEVSFDNEIRLAIPRYSMSYIVVEPKEEAVISKTGDIGTALRINRNTKGVTLNFAEPAHKILLKLYSLKGELLETIGRDFLTAGQHDFSFKESFGRGLYLLELSSDGFKRTQKIRL